MPGTETATVPMPQPVTAPTAQTLHPTWCDPTCCTAQACPAGDLPVEHRSTVIGIPADNPAVVAVTVGLVQPADEPDPAVALQVVDQPYDVPDRSFRYRLSLQQAVKLRDALRAVANQLAAPGVRPWNNIDHPGWCDVDRCPILDDDTGHRTALVHLSRPIACTPAPGIDLDLAVYLRQEAAHPHLAATHLEFTLPHDLQAFPFLPGQVNGLHDALTMIV